MSATVSGRIWDDASAPPAVRLVRRYEADWAVSPPGRRPEIEHYLPDDASARPSARLALLRAEMALLRSAHEPHSIEDYLRRFPDLDDETLVGLIYEELCLREDDGETVNPAEYLERFPRVADQLRRVLEIHDLVGSARTISLPTSGPAPTAVTFPEVGQTIAGFRLVAELGRGSFARVFQARERQLADRPVALKVARTGSREPQTLARLQHTHIVPVHSYRIDQVTGLHLLCMPYLGGVTLERLLADPQVNTAGQGTDLLAALDRLGTAEGFSIDRAAAARRELARRDFWRAVAWWGARMAEALQHAHERGVLHRDIKPSNVLVTADGAPMLLDFNLAWEACIDDPDMEAGGLGGTVAYMAPEHLEAVADGEPGGVDARSDIYSLGVLLYEAMGQRPFPPPGGARSVIESLLRAAALRREGPPALRDRDPRVPPELEAVIMRCLAPDPADRYPDAANLAMDLQAVADDAPLRLAREPLASRSVRWLRRNRLRVAVAVPLMLAPTVVVFGLALARLERERVAGVRFGEVKQLIEEGKTLLQGDQIAAAEFRFTTALELARDNRDRSLELLEVEARDKHGYVREIERIRTAADTVLRLADPLKLELLGFTGRVGDPSAKVRHVLAPFYVLSDGAVWTRRPDLSLLNDSRRDRLLSEIDNLLFLWVIALDNLSDADPEARGLSEQVCRRALTTTDSPEPWKALLALVLSRDAQGRVPRAADVHPRPRDIANARECFLWGVLCMHERQTSSAIRWLTRASHVDVDQFWYSFYLGYLYQLQGDTAAALGQYNVAIALRPELPWARFNRARLYQTVGAYQRSIDDLQAALTHTRGPDRLPILLNLALVQEDIGELGSARSGYEAVLHTAPAGDPLHRAARMNLARMDAQSGALPDALLAYDNLLRESSGRDDEARQARAMAALRLGRLDVALEDLEFLLASQPDNPDWLAARAEALLLAGRPDEAVASAEAAERIEPSPGRRRLSFRAQLASGTLKRLHVDRPDELVELLDTVPEARSTLRGRAIELERSQEFEAILDLALIRSALKDHASAVAACGRALEIAPGSSRALQARARVHARSGHLAAAFSDVETAMALDPDDPRLLAIRAELSVRSGAYLAALEDLDRIRALGASVADSKTRAMALWRLGRHEQAIVAWTEVLRANPENAEAYLARADCLRSLGAWDQSVADLEKAANWSVPRLDLLSRITLGYVHCLPARPDLFPRVISLCRRTLRAAISGHDRGEARTISFAQRDR